ncbi:putative phosphatidylinositol glycan, class W protein [Monocercomonoides exilis]|uniref:putative phosphatidylinositol glycan, class W protein n=1 Tax=Monocercomonoides exilis TaxID=2049356 RepID=UPI00355A7533|nr:putative phosphatidylinositol glycan, class W protein [Monocercomonoides exilis]|eukprot:MONOS_4804.1-p1 / transcript=MONOS_4804.1 / gene=MONOS_4804 / organism=Monocercomonoides_exilis_PA203 / gene_product=phosphatidylinositol glycan, class W protein / transcript_product=phosphatidylinositol glycan, class W protein / location=Mono_scaffold00133:55832-58245(+) / protein_length=434 / sequence_SO=supercontig / SO=protein_coding / is_pseudo=false
MAVDFPPHLPSVTKTHAMGCSFMDAGIALTACGSASSFHRRMNRQFRDKPFTRKSLLSIAKGYLIKDGMLFLMGVFRTTFLLASGYSYDVNEYGVHWNFFFTLCQLDISVLLIMWITNDYEWKPLWLSIFILIAYSTSLKFFCLEDLFVSPRFNTFLGENFEGLFSSFGFPLFHFAASYLTFLVEKEHRSVTSIFRYFVYISTCAILLALMPKILAFCLDKFTSLLEIIILPPASTSMNLYSTEKDGVLSVIDRLLRSMQSSFEMHPARRMCNFPFVMRCLSYRLFTKVYSWIFVFCESLITDSPSSQAEILPLQDNSRSKTSLSSSLSSSTTTSLTSTSSSSSSSSSSSLSKPANQSTFFSYLFSRQQFITFLSANIMIGLNHVLFEPSHFQNRRATAVLLCFIILVVCGISYVFSTILSLIGRRNKKKRQN